MTSVGTQRCILRLFSGGSPGVTKTVTAAIASLVFVVSAYVGVRAEQLTSDEKERIQIAISLIKLGCGTGVSKEETKIGANADASFTLKKLPGVAGGGEVTFSKTEAQALAASLQETITREAVSLSEHQLSCMKPYVDVVFGLLFPARSASSEPRPLTEPLIPVSMTLLAKQTQPLDGYAFISPPVLPSGLAAGPVLPGGGRTRIVFQASNPEQVVQIDKVSIVVRALSPISPTALSYAVDPLKQPGFGAARPRQFLVRFGKSAKPSVFYINLQNKSLPVTADNILPKGEFSILELDSHSGLQEALDVTVVPEEPGLYEVSFRASATSGGQEYDLQTIPLYVVRH